MKELCLFVNTFDGDRVCFSFYFVCVFRCESVKSVSCWSSEESLHLLQLILLGDSLCSCWNLPGFTFDKHGKCRLRWVRISCIIGCRFRSLKRDWALVYTFLKLRLFEKWIPSPEKSHKISTYIEICRRKVLFESHFSRNANINFKSTFLSNV